MHSTPTRRPYLATTPRPAVAPAAAKPCLSPGLLHTTRWLALGVAAALLAVWWLLS